LYYRQQFRDFSFDGNSNLYLLNDYSPIVDHERSIVKLNPSYERQWKVIVDSSMLDGIEVDKDGNVFLFNPSGKKTQLTKYDADGHLEWRRNLPFTAYRYYDRLGVDAFCADGDGNVFTGGYLPDSLGLRLMVMKHSASGDVLWTYTQTETDPEFNQIYVTGILNIGKNIYVSGFKARLEGYRPQGFLMKLFDPDNTTGLAGSDVQRSWKLHPVPASGLLWLEGKPDGNSAEFVLSGADGRVMNLPYWKEGEGKWIFDISQLPTGCYFLKGSCGSDVFTRKIIVLR
jgi:hypothetical protein